MTDQPHLTDPMDVSAAYRQLLMMSLDGLRREGRLPEWADLSAVKMEEPRDPEHGDLATNAGMVVAKAMGEKPRDVAADLARRLEEVPSIDVAEVAGPGFVNLRVSRTRWIDHLRAVLGEGSGWGATDIGRGAKVNVEFVSANPTGPLTVGHARGAVVGDALASILGATGHDVRREYYVNDAGSQVDDLARSVHLRYRELLGEDVGEFPKDLYPGEYVKDVARAARTEFGDGWADADEASWLPKFRLFAVERLLEVIKGDLDALGARHDVFTRESELHADGRLEGAIRDMRERGLVYDGVPAPPKGSKAKRDEADTRERSLFASSRYGDDQDRTVLKPDGTPTYFAGDIAYHRDKCDRGHDLLVDVLGADHVGYVPRLKAVVEAVSKGRTELEATLVQMVSLTRDGEPVKMSKRSGEFVTLRDVIDEVGADVTRFVMLTRKNDAQLEFDLERVREQSKDNPVWYVQYAHARACSALRHAGGAGSVASPADLSRRLTERDLALVKKVARWPARLAAAAQAREPHRVAYYLTELAGELHAFWTLGNHDPAMRFVVEGDDELTRARLAVLSAVRLTLADGLELLGVRPMERMDAPEEAAA